MASISHNKKTGHRTIQVVCADGKRRSIRLGKVNKRVAEEVRTKVEAVNAALIAGVSLDRETAEWLGDRGAPFYDKLEAIGLVPKRVQAGQVPLAKFIDDYLASRTDLEPSTIRNLEDSRNRLVRHFGPDRPIHTISEGDADDWRQSMVNAEYATATISKTVKNARRFFKHARRKKLIQENVFEELETGGEQNTDRLWFVERSVIQRVIDACPDAQWRLIVALSRYGGLRCPSEHLALTWGDINWDHSRMIVHASKTRRHVGKATRIVPIFPELLPFLEAVWDEAQPGTEYVLTHCQNTAPSTLRGQFMRILDHAGIEHWPRLFHNLRASRQTELADIYPAHVVASWMGNSPAIAERHYLQTIETHFQRAASEPTGAVQNPVQLGAVSGRQEPYGQNETSEFPGVYGTLPLSTGSQTVLQGSAVGPNYVGEKSS